MSPDNIFRTINTMLSKINTLLSKINTNVTISKIVVFNIALYVKVRVEILLYFARNRLELLYNQLYSKNLFFIDSSHKK